MITENRAAQITEDGFAAGNAAFLTARVHNIVCPGVCEVACKAAYHAYTAGETQNVSSSQVFKMAFYKGFAQDFTR